MSGFSFYKSEYIEFVIIEKTKIHFGQHCHSSDYSVSVITCGSVILKCNSSAKQLCCGESFMIEPYKNHSLFSDEAVSVITMCIKSQFVHSQDIIAYRLYIEKACEAISRIVSVTDGCIAALKSAADLIYSAYHSSARIATSILRNSISFIECCPETEESIDELSHRAYVSKYHYIRIFREECGLTPHQFIIQNRIRKSQRLLIDGHTATETAQITGFFDQSHFNRCFKKIVGITPSEYIRTFRNFLQA